MKKITFNEYKTLKGYNQKQMSVFLETFAQDAYKQGYDACKNDVSNGIDFDLLKIAIKATVGVGPCCMRGLWKR